MRNPTPNHVLISDRGMIFREPADNVRLMFDIGGVTFSHLEWSKFAWPGGYEIHYYAKDGGVLCVDCANKEVMRTIDPDDEQFYIVGADLHQEGPPIQCDHCSRAIESDYGDPEVEAVEGELKSLGFSKNAHGLWGIFTLVGGHFERHAFEDPVEALEWYRERNPK